MSETMSSVEFGSRISTREAIEAVQAEGAIAIHNFLPQAQLWRAATFLTNAQMRIDDNNTADVHRRQQLAEYGYAHGQPWAPQIAGIEIPSEPVFNVAREIDDFVTGRASVANTIDVSSDDSIEGAIGTFEAPIKWRPNRILAHRYDFGDFINPHRDFTREAIGYIAVLTVGGSQVFGFERDNGEKAELLMEPGTLTLMRGHQPGTGKQRPLHWVEPATQRRLAVSLRQARLGW